MAQGNLNVLGTNGGSPVLTPASGFPETINPRPSAGPLYLIRQSEHSSPDVIQRNSYTSRKNEKQDAEQPQQSISAGRLTGPVQVFVNLIHTWQIPDEVARVLLGFEQSEKADYDSILSGRTTLKGIDRKARIVHLYAIYRLLHSMLQDAEAEKEWLIRAQPALEDKTPLTLFEDGSMESLLKVKHFLELIAGHGS